MIVPAFNIHFIEQKRSPYGNGKEIVITKSFDLVYLLCDVRYAVLKSNYIIFCMQMCAHNYISQIVATTAINMVDMVSCGVHELSYTPVCLDCAVPLSQCAWVSAVCVRVRSRTLFEKRWLGEATAAHLKVKTACTHSTVTRNKVHAHNSGLHYITKSFDLLVTWQIGFVS